jgi:ABC-2 type transport system ATP-binding protein
MIMNAIELNNLTKTFGNLNAVDNVTLSVGEGELFGLLGPNGAGKTTIINMLITLLKPTCGTATVAGFDVSTGQDMIRRHIGIIFQDPSLDSGLTGRENIEFHAMMYGMSGDRLRENIARVLEVVDLTEKADILVQYYSGGMKRRLEIARGLVHEPRILFLDEPTLGLDAQTRRKIWEYLRNLNRKFGITVILTTHYMEEADSLCNRIAIIDHGRIIALDSPQNLKSSVGGDLLTLELNEESTDPAMKLLAAIAGVKKVSSDGLQVSVIIPQAERRLPSVVSKLHSHGIEINSAIVNKPSLEEVFITLTGSMIREQNGSLSDRLRSFTVRRMRR